ncbi:MAG: DUF2848 family protein [Bacillota bacterium]
MAQQTLELFIDGRFDRRIEFTVAKIINAGYAGRNQGEVRKHIEELKALGVPAPDKTPTFFPKPANLITTGDYLEVADTDNTGEAEYVLLVGENEIYVAAGSDHTDRKLEVTSILKAKQMYPNFISRAVWRLADVEDHWDDIILCAWVNGQREKVYQKARLSALLTPRDLLALVRPLVGGQLAGTVIYSGTVATKGEIAFSPRFEMELVDEIRGKTLYCGYSVHLIDWFKENG